MPFDRVPQRSIGINNVDVAPPFARFRQHLCRFEIDQDLRNRAFRDSNDVREIANAQRRILCKCDEYVCVVA